MPPPPQLPPLLASPPPPLGYNSCAMYTDIGSKTACATLNGPLLDTCNTSRVGKTLCALTRGECRRAVGRQCGDNNGAAAASANRAPALSSDTEAVELSAALVTARAAAAASACDAAQAAAQARTAHVCAVVISAAPHLHLLPQVVRSITSQTLRPRQIMIALSGVTPEQCAIGTASVAQTLADESARLGTAPSVPVAPKAAPSKSCDSMKDIAMCSYLDGRKPGLCEQHRVGTAPCVQAHLVMPGRTPSQCRRDNAKSSACILTGPPTNASSSDSTHSESEDEGRNVSLAAGGMGDGGRTSSARSANATNATWDWRMLCTDQQRSSGQNRNRGAAQCLAYEKDDAFISFVDSDDLMCSRRDQTAPTRLLACAAAHTDNPPLDPATTAGSPHASKRSAASSSAIAPPSAFTRTLTHPGAAPLRRASSPLRRRRRALRCCTATRAAASRAAFAQVASARAMAAGRPTARGECGRLPTRAPLALTLQLQPP